MGSACAPVGSPGDVKFPDEEVVVDVKWLVVAVVNLNTPFCANCANWSEVKTKGALGAVGSVNSFYYYELSI